MMANYDTYREAVIANGSTKGVVTTCEYWTGSPWFEGKFTFETKHERPAVGKGKWVKCKPADYLESLESFLASGKRLINGDYYVEDDGEVVLVSLHGDDNSISEESANQPMKNDDKRFTLQAAADQVETPEGKEAFDRIPNQDTIDAMNSEAEKESYNSASEAFDAIDTTPQQFKSLSCSGKLNDSAFLVEPDEFTLCDDIKERVGDVCMVHYQFTNSKGYEMCTIEFDDGYCHCVVAQCLETEFEREERERLEAAYDLYLTARSSTNDYTMTSHQFLNSMVKARFLAIVDKTDYRKQ